MPSPTDTQAPVPAPVLAPVPVLPLSAASKIASYAIQPASGASQLSQRIELSQATHRIRLVNAWGSSSSTTLGPGTRVLELGCGQGTCTQALAEAVGPGGHVDAADPAPPDYGRPFTLAQAQAHLSAGPVGGRIAWHRADPVSFLSDTEKTWDVAVLAHCVWYFRDGGEAELGRILSALRGRVARVLVAEYALRATEPAAAAHVLAALARATLEAHRGDSTENIQSVVSPAGIKAVAAGAGWTVESESVVVPDAALSDGFWETATVTAQDFVDEVEEAVGDERVKSLLRSARDATVAAAEANGGVKKVRTMDVWVASLTC
ncbi:hypothetical protein B0T26DRAFT_685768 [Lasiosphaeria miniovina]|uniref:Methyltransferase domain-containing protein n=1 Tax=Lasiosphaeria miniovina TaxID=1954250 RepID=A0AA40BGH2_9PEZI|nr:uncharacterized protein B0T26DRAFT_685768 [Lasiosphaeria miniovina]KAK0733799.1 hypothetical protein B0T26DRAFT_685768 [Lasiosphaeria miniovina]